MIEHIGLFVGVQRTNVRPARAVWSEFTCIVKEAVLFSRVNRIHVKNLQIKIKSNRLSVCGSFPDRKYWPWLFFWRHRSETRTQWGMRIFLRWIGSRIWSHRHFQTPIGSNKVWAPIELPLLIKHKSKLVWTKFWIRVLNYPAANGQIFDAKYFLAKL